MSELIGTQELKVQIRLLTSVSMCALLGAALVASDAASAEDDHPTVWIELGGQLERTVAPQQLFSPLFFDGAPSPVLAPMVDAQKSPQYAIGGEGKITLEPNGSDWVFSASIRYGRSNATRKLHYQSQHKAPPVTQTGRNLGIYGTLEKLGDAQGNLSATHFILDFQAGKDVGLGMFGRESTSVLTAGVRFAQFTSATDLLFHARPVYMSTPFGHPGKYSVHSRYYKSNTAVIHSKRNTESLGPSLSWDASTRLGGNDTGLSVLFDWGANAAILFGRQRATVHHNTEGYKVKALETIVKYKTGYTLTPPDQNRSRFAVIPNIGGFAGLSFRYANAKFDFGYRADFFFGAIDNGIDTQKSSTVGFYGPFAAISIGLGG